MTRPLPRAKNLQPLVCAYLDTLSFKSEHTVNGYGLTLRDFARFCEFQTEITNWSEADANTIRGYIIWRRKEAKVSGRTIARDLSVIRSFFEYLIDEQIVQGNPTVGIRAPKHEKKLPMPLDVDQCDQLLSFECKTPMDYRDKAMFELLYSSGLRVAELVNLNPDDVDLDAGMLRVIRGKGGYDRDIPFGQKATDAIRVWLEHRPSLAPLSEPALFVSRLGKRISIRNVQAQLAHWSGKQIGYAIHPHILRHSCATHLLEGSHDLRAVQEMLGHVDIGSTAIYTHLDLGYAADSLKQHHPSGQCKERKEIPEGEGTWRQARKLESVFEMDCRLEKLDADKDTAGLIADLKAMALKVLREAHSQGYHYVLFRHDAVSGSGNITNRSTVRSSLRSVALSEAAEPYTVIDKSARYDKALLIALRDAQAEKEAADWNAAAMVMR